MNAENATAAVSRMSATEIDEATAIVEAETALLTKLARGLEDYRRQIDDLNRELAALTAEDRSWKEQLDEARKEAEHWQQMHRLAESIRQSLTTSYQRDNLRLEEEVRALKERLKG